MGCFFQKKKKKKKKKKKEKWRLGGVWGQDKAALGHIRPNHQSVAWEVSRAGVELQLDLQVQMWHWAGLALWSQ